MATKEFKLPDIGEGIAEGEIVSWKVEVGQEVKEEDEFVEVMTDKATVMITAPFDGVVKELKAGEGDVVPVESVIAVFETGGGGGSAPAKDSGEKKEKQDKKKDAEKSRDEAPKEESKAEDESKGDGKPVPPSTPPRKEDAEAPAAQNGNFVQASPGKVLAAPATRRRAREMGIDLSEVEPSGPRGRITNDDLAAFLKRQDAGEPVGGGAAASGGGMGGPAMGGFKPVSVPPPPSGRTEERIKFAGVRRKIAEAMTRSKYTATHFTYVDDIDVTDLVRLRKEAKGMYADEGINITYLPFIMKAVVKAMKKFPTMNASLDETTNELVVKHYYNFGVATDTEKGLVVPVVKDVDQKSIVELAAEIQELAQKTRDGQVAVEDLSGGTFSITNAGNIGGLFATPVINFPEVAILGVHAIKQTPVVRDGRIVVGDVMYLSVSIDHRIVDGATGAHWMNVIKAALENPKQLLLG